MYALRDERSVFTSNTRHLVYVRVVENPGASIQDIATMLHISHPTAAYHLKILQGNGLVVAMRDGNRTRFFKRAEGLNQDQQRLVVANRSVRTRQILEIVRQRPMIHRKELARLLSVPRTTVNWHVDRLIQRGLLAERRAGRYCQLFLPLQYQGNGAAPAPAQAAEAPGPASYGWPAGTYAPPSPGPAHTSGAHPAAPAGVDARTQAEGSD